MYDFRLRPLTICRPQLTGTFDSHIQFSNVRCDLWKSVPTFEILKLLLTFRSQHSSLFKHHKRAQRSTVEWHNP